MKRSIIFAATMVLTVMLYCTQSFAQSSSGMAADKQKQANLEKNKAHQKEMKKKYNAMSPEEKRAAEKKANEYKKSGGKTTTGKGTPTKPYTKPATPAKPSASSSKSTQAKPAATNSSTKPAPIFMDANGKPLNNSATPAIPATPAAKTTPKPTPLKTTAPSVGPASEKVKK